MILEIRNTTDHKLLVLAPVQDAGTSRLNYTLAVSLPAGTLDGEYEYILRRDEEILSTGLIRIGTYENAGTGYDDQVNYTQYGD